MRWLNTSHSMCASGFWDFIDFYFHFTQFLPTHKKSFLSKTFQMWFIMQKNIQHTNTKRRLSCETWMFESVRGILWLISIYLQHSSCLKLRVCMRCGQASKRLKVFVETEQAFFISLLFNLAFHFIKFY